MAQLSVSAAARAVGKDRGTIHRYIKSGKLSVSKNTMGHTVVETAELLRVFGVLQGDGVAAVAQHAAKTAENSSVQQVLEATLELLKEQLKASQDREERLLVMLGQEQEARRDLERRLLPSGTGQTPEEQAAEEPPKPGLDVPAQEAAAQERGERKGFFATLFGK